MIRTKINKTKSTMNKSSSCCAPERFTDEVRRKAQELYEKSGRKPGRDLDNWLEAERIVNSEVCK